MAYKQNIEGCLEAAIGANGLSEVAYKARLDKLGGGIDKLRQQYEDGSLALLQVPDAQDDLDDAKAAYEALIPGAETVVFFGTGGSSLGGQTVALDKKAITETTDHTLPDLVVEQIGMIDIKLPERPFDSVVVGQLSRLDLIEQFKRRQREARRIGFGVIESFLRVVRTPRP